jgi:cyclopropane fatty-acyl-phospholipid synthase-like methyltransferase
MSEEPYWDRFYQRPHPDLEEPSSFARVCVARLSPDLSVFEIGCGNGRDALYMARSGLRVVASDPSHVALAEVRSRMHREGLPHSPRLVARRMEDLDDRHAGELDAVYMRFVLHAVTSEVASAGLRWASRNLGTNGRLFVEARSVLGSLYGQGEPAGRDAFIQDGHYRRFIRLDELRDEIADIGFQIDELTEGAGLAIHGADDPVLIRAFATLPSGPRS